MKRFFACLLAGAMMLSFAACSQGNGSSSSTADSSSEAGTSSAESSAVSGDLSGIVKTGGSTSVEKVMNALIYKFQENNQNVTINYEMNGSGDGIQGVIDGKYEIGHSSRDLKEEEEAEGLVGTAYAVDGIALVVNNENTASNLTAEQVKGIYTGEITNWSEVGGADAPITVVIREAGSGTRSAFGEIVGVEDADLVSTATECKDTGAVQTTVSQNANAIGYMSFSDLDTSMVKPINYEGVAISEDTLKDGSYTLQRSFLMVTKEGAELSPAAQAFMDFVLSDEGQQLVTDNKLIPIK